MASRTDERTSFGRIDVHAHLLPAVDDGCRDVAESVACARKMVEAGYTHLFCTPHIWPTLPGNNIDTIPQLVADLQGALDEARVPLTLLPGGEINLRPNFMKSLQATPERVVTYGMARRFVIFDFWADELPNAFEPTVAWWRSLGLTVILAHPERIGCFQRDPSLIDRAQAMGCRLQGNLQCFADDETLPTRQLAERWLSEGRYWLLGSDLHRLDTLDHRLRGLRRAIESVGEAAVGALTAAHPRELLP
jgi:protein-tyrosine phosphatase